MGLDSQRPQPLPFDQQFAVQREKFNSMNWHENPDFYMVGTDQTTYQVCSPDGWGAPSADTP